MRNLYEIETPERRDKIGDPGLHSVGLASDAVLRAREFGDPIAQRDATLRLAHLVANEPRALEQLAQIQEISLELEKSGETDSPVVLIETA